MIHKLLLLTCTALPLACGCGDMPDYASALSKLGSDTANPPIGDLTGPEITALSNHKADLGALFNLPAEQIDAIPALTPDEGQAIADFMDQHNLRTVSDLQILAVQVAIGEQTVEIPDALRRLVESISFPLATRPA